MANTLDRLEIAVAQNDKDWNSVKNAIVEKGIAIPQGTPTSEYGTKIKQIETGIDTSQDTVTAESIRQGFTAHDAAGQPIVGVIPDYNGDISVELTSPNGVTLATAETYCETDIEVIPKLQNKTVIENGTIVPDDGYAGLKQVTVDVPQGPDLTSDTVTPAAMLKDYTAHDASGNQITGAIGTYAGSIQQGAVEDAQIRYDEGYEAGYTEGHAAGEAVGVEVGKRAESEAFWDTYTKERGSFIGLFAGVGWSRNTFKPKSSLHVTGEATNMFYFNSLGGDLVELFESNGYEITFTDISGANGMFNFASFTRLPVIVFTSGIDIYNTFGASTNLITIDGIVIDETNKFTYTFNNCPSLVNLTIIGTIGQGGLNLSRSPLSKASLTSVVNALSSTTTGLTVTLRLSAVNAAFETSEGTNDGSTSEEWLALAATKSNWTINLIDS